MVSLALHCASMIRAFFVAVILGALAAAGCRATPRKATSNGVPLLADVLIPASTTMMTAWDVPQNPLADQSRATSRLSKDIRWGYKLFTDTPHEARQYAPGKMSCSNCHLNAGQRERSLPLVGVAGMFPEYNRRSGRLYSLNDRIVDCFMRSENATGAVEDESPSTTSPEVLALSAYITWIARGSEVGKNPAWRGQNVIEASHLIPVEKLDPRRGEALFIEHCTNCHGEDGQGVAIGDKKPGPLWGPDSWNDGAGAARIYTLAGII